MRRRSLALLMATALLMVVATPAKAPAALGFSSPQPIVTVDAPDRQVRHPHVAMDPQGQRHLVFSERSLDESTDSIVYTIIYQGPDGNTEKIAQEIGSIDPIGARVTEPHIALDLQGGIHVVYAYYNFDTEQSSIRYVMVPKILVLLPGLNDHGEEMIKGAQYLVRYDDRCVGTIAEVDNPSQDEIRQLVQALLSEALSIGKDVVINIDMDLEDFSWEYIFKKHVWDRSTKWAGKVANLVSSTFKENCALGIRMLYAHSAGGDATRRSVEQGRKKRMFEGINIFNGRTTVKELERALKRAGYSWWQVKVFTQQGDLPASPWWLSTKGGSISNKDAARSKAGEVWVHIHSTEYCDNYLLEIMPQCHNTLRDQIGEDLLFEVFLSPSINPTYSNCVTSPAKMILWNWQWEASPCQ